MHADLDNGKGTERGYSLHPLNLLLSLFMIKPIISLLNNNATQKKKSKRSNIDDAKNIKHFLKPESITKTESCGSFMEG